MSEGQIITLPDGRAFKFLWSGSICKVTNSLLLREAHQKSGMPSTSGREWLTCKLSCKQCDHKFELDELYYNRRGPRQNKKSRYYCLQCATHLGLIELVSV